MNSIILYRNGPNLFLPSRIIISRVIIQYLKFILYSVWLHSAYLTRGIVVPKPALYIEKNIKRNP